MTEVDLSVVVVTHHGAEMAITTLQSARKALGTISAEWLVVDSGSTDDTAERVAAAVPEARVFVGPNVGFAAANNVAIARARGRYVLLLNPDVEILRGTLAELVAGMDERPEVAVLGPIQTGADGRLLFSQRRDPSPLRRFGEALQLWRVPGLHRLQEPVREPAAYHVERPADWLSGAFLLVRRAALELVGPLDERFFLFSEEVDWCLRFRHAGWQVLHVPWMKVLHHVGSAESPRLTAQMDFSRTLYAQKHFGPARRAAFRLAMLGYHLVRVSGMAPRAVVGRGRRARLTGEWWALRILLGLTDAPLSRPANASFRELADRAPAAAG